MSTRACAAFAHHAHCAVQSPCRHYSGLAAPTLLRRIASHYRKGKVASEDAVNPLTRPTNIDKASLHVVSVPIGNLKDFSLRGLDVLREVDYIVTSDRPATRTLLDLVDIPNQGRLIHYSRANHTITTEKLVELLKGGRSMALVTTSGTPCVGDVGSELVREMQASGVRVTSVPGCSAVMSALAMTGVTGSKHDLGSKTSDEDSPRQGSAALLHGSLQDGSFFFGNMLPDSHGARLRVLRNVVAPAHYPCIFYELPRRLLTVLQDMAVVLPQRRIFVVHEMTKLNESVHADTAERLVSFYLRQEAHALVQKGQVVLVVEGAGAKETAAWLEKEARKRMRLRRSVDELMGEADAQGGHSPSTPNTDGDAGHKTRLSAKAKRRARLKQLRRKKRERLIAEIEKEQEKLRVKMQMNRDDAKRF